MKRTCCNAKKYVVINNKVKPIYETCPCKCHEENFIPCEKCLKKDYK
jgi:hypothetical protein